MWFGDLGKYREGAGYGRTYKVFIEAEDERGNRVEFVELVEYPDRRKDLSGCVHEQEREADAVQQVRSRMPRLRKIRATHSIHT